MKKSSVNWKNNFSQLGDFFNSTKLIVFLNIYSWISLAVVGYTVAWRQRRVAIQKVWFSEECIFSLEKSVDSDEGGG